MRYVGVCAQTRQQRVLPLSTPSLEGQVATLLARGLHLAGCLDRLKTQSSCSSDPDSTAQALTGKEAWTRVHDQVECMYTTVASLAGIRARAQDFPLSRCVHCNRRMQMQTKAPTVLSSAGC
jgi:hypothetical protein